MPVLEESDRYLEVVESFLREAEPGLRMRGGSRIRLPPRVSSTFELFRSRPCPRDRRAPGW